MLRDAKKSIETGTTSKILVVVFIAVSLGLTSELCVVRRKNASRGQGQKESPERECSKRWVT